MDRCHGGLSVPYAVLSLAIEFTAACVLLSGAALLALAPQIRAAGRPAVAKQRLSHSAAVDKIGA